MSKPRATTARAEKAANGKPESAKSRAAEAREEPRGAAPRSAGAAGAAADGAAMERAEALVDQLGERVGRWASLAGLRLTRATARAREEAEDIWAEAHAIRDRRRS